MLDFYNDNTIKIEYDPQTNKESFAINAVGATAGETIEVYSGITPTDTNSIYVSDTVGNDTTGTGTSALPYKTILKSIDECTVAKIYVIILDSATYSEDLGASDNVYFSKLYANTAQTPVLSLRTLSFTPADANSIFVSDTIGNDSTGDGSQSTPYKTIAVGASNCDATHQKVVILDSATYTGVGVEFTGNFLGLYAAIGQAPTCSLIGIVNQNLSNQIGVTTTFLDAITSYNASGVFSNDNFVIAYRNGEGYFKIYNSLGVQQGGEVQFSSNVARHNRVGILSNDNFVIVYQDFSDSNKGKFVIYNSAGVEQVSAVTFETGETDEINIGVLSNDNFVISYRDLDDSNKGKFVIYNSAGVEQVSAVTFETDNTTETLIGVFSNDNFVISYYNAVDTESQFQIYNSAGVQQVAATAISSNLTVTTGVGVFSNDNFVLSFRDDTDSDKGKFIIYNSSGIVQVAEVTFETETVDTPYVAVFSDDNFVISYRYYDSVSGTAGKFIIYSSEGVLQMPSVTIGIYASADLFANMNDVNVFSNDNIIIVCADYNDTFKGKFEIWYPYGYDLMQVSASSVINGLIIDADTTIKKRIAFNCTADLQIDFCSIINVNDSSTASDEYSYAIYSDSEINMSNCDVHTNSIGIITTEDASVIQDCVFYNNSEGYAIDIDGAASSSGDITVEHCTIYNNAGGIRLQNNNGTNEILKNNIIHNNSSLGIYADTDIGYSYSTNTDSVTNATAGSSVLLANPLFINDGSLVAANTDLNLRLRLLGYTTDSPAASLADDSRNAGAYNVLIIGAATTWSSWSPEKPITIDVWTEPVKAVKNVRRDGSIATSREALTEYVKINFEGLLNADYLLALALLQTSESQVRIYPDPVTNPTNYNTYKYIYENVNGSASHYKLTRTGKQSISLLFARATE